MNLRNTYDRLQNVNKNKKREVQKILPGQLSGLLGEQLKKMLDTTRKQHL